MFHEAPPSALPGISPSRGEIGCGIAFVNLQCLRASGTSELLISPLEGEMAGRPEGGATERTLNSRLTPTARP
ncbi:propionyl-coenzyme A carboxylase alpha polypeptide [Mesorhizobium sp. B1-1-9]|nr:propionyl-coenzyme A carboxylase alpha polypeptide [Mesorhizobium sp. B1-1-9]TPN49737.1 propionyl-coenzyme A carboxylase alpha polypeptide [Mesorhizobium sp. B1-1-7]